MEKITDVFALHETIYDVDTFSKIKRIKIVKAMFFFFRLRLESVSFQIQVGHYDTDHVDDISEDTTTKNDGDDGKNVLGNVFGGDVTIPDSPWKKSENLTRN